MFSNFSARITGRDPGHALVKISRPCSVFEKNTIVNGAAISEGVQLVGIIDRIDKLAAVARKVKIFDIISGQWVRDVVALQKSAQLAKKVKDQSGLDPGL